MRNHEPAFPPGVDPFSPQDPPSTRRVAIHPSILAADFAHLAREIRDVEPHVDGLHLDVMDGVFVPNISFGPVVVEAVRHVTTLPLHCHLMIVDPVRYLRAFRDAGADLIIVHLEAIDEPARALLAVRECGARVGVTLNPGTPLERVEPVLGLVDELLIMSVDPGFGGQRFQPSSLERVRAASALREGRGRFLIAVDGGIGPDNAAAVVAAGADILVAGTAVFRAKDRKRAIEALRGGAFLGET